MTSLNLREHPHRRFNPLTRDWVLVSPHRTQRPWQGQVEKTAADEIVSYDPLCYMCPGNVRATGARNPAYSGTFVFGNDFPALLPDTPPSTKDVRLEPSLEASGEEHLLIAESERGICRVVCFSPRHDLTLARMDQPGLRDVVGVWVEQYEELSVLPFIRYVQIFENRGSIMGCSNPHPHGQIWASSTIPNEVRKELASLADYRVERHSCLLCDYLALELRLQERTITTNDHFAALVPFWAIWPFEGMILSRRHLTALDELSSEEGDALADILKRLTTRYDHLFETSFPYSMGFHQRPTDGETHPECHFHAHFYPPLLRSATVRKFMVGYEMLATPQRDFTPESAAERLREMKEE